jgi:hypothetical protein
MSSLLMAEIRSRCGKPVPFYDYSDETTCEYCDKAFNTPVECGSHEASCKARIIERVKYTSTKKVQKVKEATPCSICTKTGHLTVDCYVTRHLDRW